MVGYENRQPPEGINVSREHPLATFAKLAVAALALVVGLVLLVQFAGGFAAKRIPFGTERRLVERLDVEFGDDAASPGTVAYLNDLADRLVPFMDLPDGMAVDVHYDPAGTVNAFATAGGHLVFYRGLLERMPHENALAMVMAHEIAHVLHRDPVASLGGGVASSVALLVLTGNAGSRAASDVLRNAGLVTGMSFTRRMEREADAAAVDAVAGLYGHVAGASALFELAEAADGDADPGPEGGDGTEGGVDGAGEGGGERRGRRARELFERFASTHPLDADRIRAIDERARERGVPTVGETTPLPEDFSRRLDASTNR